MTLTIRARQLEHARIAQAEADYRRLILKMADNEATTDEDADRLREIQTLLAIDDDQVEKDAELVTRARRAVERIRDVQQRIDGIGDPALLREQLDQIDSEIVAATNDLIEQKQAIHRQLDDHARQADELRHAERGLAAVEERSKRAASAARGDT